METDLRDFDLKGNWSNENLIKEYFDLKIILDQIPLFYKRSVEFGLIFENNIFLKISRIWSKKVEFDLKQ